MRGGAVGKRKEAQARNRYSGRGGPADSRDGAEWPPKATGRQKGAKHELRAKQEVMEG